MTLGLRLLRPLRWRSARSTARLLLAFAAVERSSFHDLMAAANACPDPKRKAKYLRHATDEARHGDAFARRALALDPSLATDPSLYHTDFEYLYERLGEAQFVAFVYLGERRGCAQMVLFRDELLALEGTSRADPETARLFAEVVPDEEHHEAYTGRLLPVLGASVPRAALWELGRSWRRLGAGLSTLLFEGGMLALYVLLAPLAALERWRTS